MLEKHFFRERTELGGNEYCDACYELVINIRDVVMKFLLGIGGEGHCGDEV